MNRHGLQAAIFLMLSAQLAYAHPGRTDASGGHHDNRSGGYHYHSGIGTFSGVSGFSSGRAAQPPVQLRAARAARLSARTAPQLTHREDPPVSRAYHNITPPEPEPYRTWKDKTGAFSVVARFVSMTSGMVTLNRQDDKVSIVVAADKLSYADTEYLNELRRKRL